MYHKGVRSTNTQEFPPGATWRRLGTPRTLSPMISQEKFAKQLLDVSAWVSTVGIYAECYALSPEEPRHYNQHPAKHPLTCTTPPPHSTSSFHHMRLPLTRNRLRLPLMRNHLLTTSTSCKFWDDTPVIWTTVPFGHGTVACRGTMAVRFCHLPALRHT